MADDIVDRVLNASKDERSRIAPTTAVRFDPHFPVKSNAPALEAFDPMKTDFTPATSKG